MRILYLPHKYSQQRQKDVKAKIYPVLLAMEAEFYRKQGHEVEWWEWGKNWGDTAGEDCSKGLRVITEPEGLPFLDLPTPDRIFTGYQDYQDNGNFKYLPATYIQSARDCWYAKCTFCAWAKKYPVCERRSVTSVVNEIQECADMGFREIFDDSGTFPNGEWLRYFCKKIIQRGLNRRVILGCNMRFGALDLEDFDLMKQAGFRMILWGLESVNQSTLDKLNKGIQVEQAYVDLELANKAGLWNHVAVMFGYPWESWAQSKITYEFIRQGLLTNKIKTAQASIYDVEEWDNSFAPHEKDCPDFAFDFRRKVYALYRHPRYLWNRIREITSWDDVKYYLRGVKKLMGRKC
jgi:radical SAM superfamily enzyme YgiQ (UPF0313 family)